MNAPSQIEVKFGYMLRRSPKLARFHAFLAEFACPPTQKDLIMRARENEAITDTECRLLIELLGLESA